MLFEKIDLNKLPEIYSQDGLGDEAIVYLVVQLESFVWLIMEHDYSDLFFGFVYLNDALNSELGYISKDELESLAKQYPLTVVSVELTLKEAKEIYIKRLENE